MDKEPTGKKSGEPEPVHAMDSVASLTLNALASVTNRARNLLSRVTQSLDTLHDGVEQSGHVDGPESSDN